MAIDVDRLQDARREASRDPGRQPIVDAAKRRIAELRRRIEQNQRCAAACAKLESQYETAAWFSWFPIDATAPPDAAVRKIDPGIELIPALEEKP